MLGYDFDYQIYNNGTIYKKIVNEYKALGIYDNGTGYKMVSLKINGKYKLHYIHRLVATYFLNNPDSYLEVNHLDFNKSNNNQSNLEWCTRIYNVRHYHITKPVIIYKKRKRIISNIKTKHKEISFTKQCYCIDFYKYTNKWRLRISSNGARKHIGYFKTYEDALSKEKMLSL